MDPKDRQRLAVAHRILEAVRNKGFRSETLATNTGEHVIVPALPDDTMASLFEQLRAADGPLHVAVPDGKNLSVFVMVPLKGARHAGPSLDPDEDFPMSPGMSVGLVLDYLRLREKPIIFHEACPEVSLELVEKPAPAPESSHGALRAASGRLATGRRGC